LKKDIDFYSADGGYDSFQNHADKTGTNQGFKPHVQSVFSKKT
jgi:hypothetical protein